MSQDRSGAPSPETAAEPFADRYGIWSNHQIPEDRASWHPNCRRLLEYWQEIAPPGRLPGRQHVSPADIVPLLPRVWLLDVVREPLRFRYRLVGTGEVGTLGRDVTGQWLDEAHPEFRTDALLYNRYRFMVETGRPTWRRGPVRWKHDNMHRLVENCMVPLAADGRTVDIIFALSVLFNADGTEIRV